MSDADVHAARLLQAVKYANVASITILVWDYLLTLEREIRLVWKGHWGSVKILYILSRFPPFFDVPLVMYYALAPNVPLSRCQPIYAVASWFTLFGIVVAEAILMKRTVALWGVDKRIYFGLIGLMVVSSICAPVILQPGPDLERFCKAVTIPCAVTVGLFLESLRYGPPPLPTVTGCYPTEGSVIVFVDFILLILYESVMLGLTLWVGFRKFRHSRNPLIVTLYRDGIFYFVYTFVISLGNIIVLVAGPSELLDLLNTFQRVMHSILSTRIILHVRSADQQFREDNLGGTAAGATQRLSAINFAPGKSAGSSSAGKTTNQSESSYAMTTMGIDATTSTGAGPGASEGAGAELGPVPGPSKSSGLETATK
ncbi:hypothetical protein D9758_005936 [Tetrapyrgos nigripes]|uniref:DUF6533 domain-containing protein n=1 Tax=Tetrapyrgos nigripes TaxID=182062 RepID=A0A8H5G310_9AGAR|nr:hypothetical protein D9758_005936 [Tetrapyrgos nigripes]